MKRSRIAFALPVLVLLAGCVVRAEPAPLAYDDQHREWWGRYHQNEAYERDRAEREHRDWCGRTPDRSCEGWR